MRKYTNKIIEFVDEGMLDRDILIRDLLNWISESDVAEFYEHHIRDDEEDDDDGQPSEMDEWHDFDPGC
jgi:hypothetical protein